MKDPLTAFDLTQTRVWPLLHENARQIQKKSPRALLEERAASKFIEIDLDRLHLDYSHQTIDETTIELLAELAQEAELAQFLRDQVRGEKVNTTENRQALHTIFRGTGRDANRDAWRQAEKSSEDMNSFVAAVADHELRGFSGKPFKQILHIGIGGSHLGQQLVIEFLGQPKYDIRFLSNTDPIHRFEIIDDLDLEQTLVIAASKSFNTAETLYNVAQLEQAFETRTGSSQNLVKHLVIISSKTADDCPACLRHFRIPDFVGGRFSIWSAMGLPVALCHGPDQYKAFLRGGRLMDQLCMTTPPMRNPAMLLALLAVWNINILGASSHVVGTYGHHLRSFMPFVQQLEMESNGKQSSNDLQTAVPIWGGSETNGQHAWHQFLHQGTSRFSVDFVTQIYPETSDQYEYRQVANALAQSEALFHGSTEQHQLYKNLPGYRPSTMVFLKDLSPESIGGLIAMYEHKIAFLGRLWGINSYDQYGVEQGKELAGYYEVALTSEETFDEKIDQRMLRKIKKQLRS